MGFVEGSEGDQLASKMAKDIATSISPHVIISTLHFYIERVMHRLIEEFLDNPEEILKIDEKGYVAGFWKKTKVLFLANVIDDLQFQELGIINEIRNEIVHNFEPNNDKLKELCNYLLYHPYNDKKSNVEKALYDALEIMSQLCEKLDSKRPLN